MMFKPRIFVSSTIKENLKIRSKLEKFYQSIGAEALLYEKNLTPSVNPMTYRHDILEADFIIFIINNEYGAKTDRGISGTHEEFRIVQESNLPKHVYIKLEGDANDAKELIDEINDSNISYFYFRTENELLKRIKETSFTIAKEIMLRKIEEASLNKITSKKIALNYDYSEALKIIKIIETMKTVKNHWNYSYIYTNIFFSFIEPIQMYASNRDWFFIDGRLEDELMLLLKTAGKFDSHANNYTTRARSIVTHKVDVLDVVTIYRVDANESPDLHRKKYEKIIIEFFKRYNKFKSYVESMKICGDLLKNI